MDSKVLFHQDSQRLNAMTKFVIIIIFLFVNCNLDVLAQERLHVDFKYAPDWHVTNICLPDDTFKTLVGPLGQMLYDFGGEEFFPYANGKGFRTVIHILPDEQVKFTGQELYSPKVPIVKTFGEIDGLTVKQEAFSYSSDGLLKFNKKNNSELRNNAREDIILTTIKNETSDSKVLQPLVVINSEFPVNLSENIITIDSKRLYINHQIIGVRQNLGDFKSIIELGPLEIKANETKEIAVVYDNGKPSDIVQNFYNKPEETLKNIHDIRGRVINYWEEESPIPYSSIFIPDSEIQDLIDASLRNIWQAREIIDNKISFQVGPTCYRGLWIVDGAFLLEAATMVNKGKDARDGIEYMLSFQEPNGKFEKISKYWKESGIVLWICVRHAMLTQDKDWLKSIWPKLSKTVNFIKKMREITLENDTPLDDGLIPPGFIDGGLAGGDYAEYTNVYWNLLGLKAMVKAADWLGEINDAKEWQKEYDEFNSVFQKAAHRDMVKDSYGNKFLPIPMDPKDHSLPQRAQWAFCQAVYPGQIFAKDDPIATGTMDMLHTTLQQGMVMGTGWIIDGIWNYFASFYGHACLWMGDGNKAAQSLYAFANHASPMLSWREEHNPRDLERHFVGDMPHNWASAEFVRLAVHLLSIDRGRELHLFEGLPKEWVKSGMETALREIATPFGNLTVSLKVDSLGKNASLNIESLSDKSCERIVIHLDNWATKEMGKTIELDPKTSHSVNINLE